MLNPCLPLPSAGPQRLTSVPDPHWSMNLPPCMLSPFQESCFGPHEVPSKSSQTQATLLGLPSTPDPGPGLHNIGGGLWTPRKGHDLSWAPVTCTHLYAADIVFLLDGSSSIGRNNFKEVQGFLEGLVLPFSGAASAQGVRFATVQYSDDPR